MAPVSPATKRRAYRAPTFGRAFMSHASVGMSHGSVRSMATPREAAHTGDCHGRGHGTRFTGDKAPGLSGADLRQGIHVPRFRGHVARFGEEHGHAQRGRAYR